MRRLLSLLALLLALIPLTLALSAIMGVGLLRDGPIAAVAAASVALVALPCIGLTAALGGKLEGAAVGTLLWPSLVLVGLPLYFPGEREQALSTGMGFLAAPMGADAARQAADLGQQLASLMGEESLAGEPPATPLEPVTPELPKAAAQLPDDAIALPYEGKGRSLLIPVVFEGRKTHELSMLFDTGATYTTLSAAALKQLGSQVPADAPEITLHTANGERQARVVLVDRVWLGGFEVPGVAIAVCEECADEKAGGLLGLNVSGQFMVTVDPERQEVVLQPREGSPDRQLDVLHWVDVQATATAWSDGRVAVEVSAENRSQLSISEVLVGIHCKEETFQAQLEGVAAGETRTEKVSLPRGSQCEQYHITLQEARW